MTDNIRRELLKAFGAAATFMLARPDGYLAWRGSAISEPGLRAVLLRTVSPAKP